VYNNWRSGRNKYSFHRLPAVLHHQGQQMLEISSERKRAWLKAISRVDLTEEKLANVYVCERHFVTARWVTSTTV